MERRVYILSIYVLLSLRPAHGKDCKTVDSCSCTFDDGSGTIDLSGVGVQGGAALIQDQFAQDGFAYSYNPCYPFSEGTCYETAACQFDSANIVYYMTGDPNTATFSYDGANVLVTYTTPEGRTTKVTLTCDESTSAPVTTVNGETSPGVYEFSVKAKQLCPTSAPPGSHPPPIEPGKITVSASVSIGTVLCIILIVVLPMYLVAGILINRFGRNRQGAEMVPNYTMWTTIPGLIKDGIVFTLGLCRPRGYSRM